MDVTGYAVIGLGGVLVLVLLIAGLLRLRRKNGDEEKAVTREEPTLEAPAAGEGAADDGEPSATPAEATTPEVVSVPQSETEPETEPEPEPEPDPVPQPESASAPDTESGPEAENEPATAPEVEHTPEPVAASAAGLEVEPKTDPEPATDEEPDPAFVAARERLDRELKAGHFSRLDVFEEYQRASEKAYGHIGPRSEYFSRVVNKAIAIRDAFEALLGEEDRKRFVEDHSRYLDDVSTEPDLALRDRMHMEQINMLQALRPGAGAEQPAD